MRLLARVSALLRLLGMGTGLLALQRGGAEQDDQSAGEAREAHTYPFLTAATGPASIPGRGFAIRSPAHTADTALVMAAVIGPGTIPKPTGSF